MKTDISIKQKQAENQSFGEALMSFDVKMMLKHLKRWDKATYKKYKALPYKEQKRLLCKGIVDNAKNLNEELVNRAKEYLKTLEVKKDVKQPSSDN